MIITFLLFTLQMDICKIDSRTKKASHDIQSSDPRTLKIVILTLPVS